MSDYLNRRGKRLVALALTDSISQQELKHRNTEHIQLDAQREAEVGIQNESGCTLEITKNNFMESKVDAPIISEGCSKTENEHIDYIQKRKKGNVQPGDIPTVSQSFDSEGLNNIDIVEKNNIMEYDNDNASITEIDPMKSKDDATIILEGCSNTENIFISKCIRAKLVDYTIETDDETDDFSAASDDDPSYQPPQEIEDIISDFSDYEIEESNVSNLTRRRKRNTANWKANVTKKQRAQCLPYKNKKKECEAKSPKPVDCTKCRFQCTMNFTEQDRTALCKSYWRFSDYQRQKDFLIKYVVVVAPKRRRKNRSSVNRTISKMYYLENASGKHRVCANFFEKTLNISNGPINTAIKGAGPTGCFSGSDKRGRKAPGNKTSEVDVSLVKEHIESFPVMESHYVRKHTQKLYLESGLSILKLYELL